MAVTTVTGNIAPAEMGVTLSHEHIFIDLFRVYQPHRDMNLHDAVLAGRELKKFADLGGRTVVDLTTPDIGRDPHRLRDISLATGLNVIMGSGRYRSPFYEAAIERVSTVALASLFIEDIMSGVDGIRPGVIGEIGTDTSYMNPSEERVHRAAARASLETGLPIITHSLGSAVGLDQLKIFMEEGVDGSRVAIGHADTWPDADYHLQLLDRGAYLVFDTIRGMVPYEIDRTIGLIRNVVNHGYSDRLLFSHDVCGTGHYTEYGGRGYTYVPGAFMVALEEAALPTSVGAAALTTNPATFFDHL